MKRHKVPCCGQKLILWVPASTAAFDTAQQLGNQRSADIQLLREESAIETTENCSASEDTLEKNRAKS